MKEAREYAVYKGEKMLAMGTSEECAAELNVTKEYVEWLTTPTAKRRLATRKNPEKCTVGFKLDDDDE
jgi:orotate phosphoribosyltransferase-like protein